MTKSLTFAIMHFSVAFGVAYALTGDIMFGSAVALVEPLVNTIGFYVQERIWTRFERRRATGSVPTSAEAAVPCAA